MGNLSVEKECDEQPQRERIGGRVVDILAAVEYSVRWASGGIRGQATAAAAEKPAGTGVPFAGSVDRRLVVANCAERNAWSSKFSTSKATSNQRWR